MILKSQPGWYGKMLGEQIKKLNEGDYTRIPLIFCVFAEKHDKYKPLAAKHLTSYNLMT